MGESGCGDENLPELVRLFGGSVGVRQRAGYQVVLKLVSEQQSKVNPYAGKMTGPAMWEYLSKSGESGAVS